MLYFVGRRLVSPVVRAVFRMRFSGLENIPEHGGLILCSNHLSVIDPVFLAVAVKRQIRYMAKSELFDDHGGLARRLLYALGAFPVRRNTGDAGSVKTAVSIVEEGGVLGIFPQGGCVRGDVPFRPKAGIALVASRAQSPVLPACIDGGGTIKPLRRVTVRFGPVIPFEALGLEDDSRESLRRASQIIARRVTSLLEEKD